LNHGLTVAVAVLAAAGSAAGTALALERPVSPDEVRWAVTRVDVAPYQSPGRGARRRRNGEFAKVAELCRRSRELVDIFTRERLTDDNPRVRAATVEVLCLSGSEAALGPLEQALFLDPHFDIRTRAARMLVAFGRPELAPGLLRPWLSLSAKELRAVRSGPYFRRIVRDLVDSVDPGGRLEDYSCSTDGELAAAAEEELFWPGRNDRLARERKRPERAFRCEAIMLLGLVRAEEAVGVLAARLHGSDEVLAVAACNSLAAIGTRQAHEALAGGLASTRERIASACLHHLSRAGVEVDPAVLRGFMDSKNAVLRRAAARVAAAAKSPESNAGLARALGDRDSLVRRAAIAALGRSGDARSAKALVELFAKAPAHESSLARGALAAIGSRIERRTSPEERSADESAAVWIGAMVSRKTFDLRTLREALSDTHPGVRSAALRRAADLIGRSSTSPITASLADEDPGVRIAAARALGHLCRPRSVGELDDQTWREGALAAAEAILAACDTGGERFCVVAYEAVGNLGLTDLAGRLVDRLKVERRPGVRRSIGRTLRRLTGRDFGDDARRWSRWLGAAGGSPRRHGAG